MIEGVIKCVSHKNGGVYPRLIAKNVYFLEGKVAEQLNESVFDEELVKLLSNIPHYGFLPHLKSVVFKLLPEVLDLSQPNKKIKVLVIHGRNAQTHKDFELGLRNGAGEYFSFFDLSFCEITLSSDKELAEAVKKGKNHDLIFIVRGGGEKVNLRKSVEKKLVMP